MATDHVRKSHSIVQAPLLPPYSRLANAIKMIDGERVQRVRDLIKALWDQTGTPQNPVDWSDPDVWIKDRLNGPMREQVYVFLQLFIPFARQLMRLRVELA